MASNNTELKIDDDYINSQAEQIAKWACDLQGGIDKYTAILNNILADGGTHEISSGYTKCICDACGKHFVLYETTEIFC